MRRTAACLVLLTGLVGCRSASSPPMPTSADFEGTVAELDRAHIAVDEAVSGDPGCNDPTLAPTAIRFTAHGLDQTSDVPVYLYRFRDGATYDRLRPEVDRCARSFVTDPDAYVAIDARPLVAVSPGPWRPAFTDAMRSALDRAAAGG